MYKIEKKGYGFKLTFGGATNKEELEKWLKEAEDALRMAKPGFGAIIDMRTLVALRPDAQAVIVKGQGLFRAKGLQRSSVILNDPVVTGQFMRLAKQSGVYEYERYFDASGDPQWQRHAEDWVRTGADPDAVNSQIQRGSFTKMTGVEKSMELEMIALLAFWAEYSKHPRARYPVEDLVFVP